MTPRYWVYWDKGRCNDGDHDSGFEPFDSYELAVQKANDVRSYNWYSGYGTVSIVIGTEVTVPEEPR